MHGNGIDAYRKTNVTTADPKRLVLMCYEGAISNLKIAREKYASKEYEAKAKAVQKAQDIITLLMQSLDFEGGGKIAVSLEALYNYMLRRLIDGDVKKDTKIIDEVIYLLEELESAWKEIFRTSENSSFISDTGQEKQARVAGDY
ncbi:MAG: flagellar export chaperone FliS [Desulfobacterales bacterium]|nr:flagellar export chaperone FliS [Desulfobacterales bacterium]